MADCLCLLDGNIANSAHVTGNSTLAYKLTFTHPVSGSGWLEAHGVKYGHAEKKKEKKNTIIMLFVFRRIRKAIAKSDLRLWILWLVIRHYFYGYVGYQGSSVPHCCSGYANALYARVPSCSFCFRTAQCYKVLFILVVHLYVTSWTNKRQLLAILLIKLIKQLLHLFHRDSQRYPHKAKLATENTDFTSGV
jgi:hypothetical protein